MGIRSYTVTVQGANNNEVNIRIKDVSKDDIQKVQATFEENIKKKYPEAVSIGDVNYVGPVAGATLVKNAVISVLLAAALMLIYIAIRFDLNSGLSAVFGLLHDVLIMLSFMVIFRSVIQMNSSFIAAALTIVGYSINNTIVIFDRIRENAKKMPTAPRGGHQHLHPGEPGPHHLHHRDHPDHHRGPVHPGRCLHPRVRSADHRRYPLRCLQRQHDQRLCLGVPGRKAPQPQSQSLILFIREGLRTRSPSFHFPIEVSSFPYCHFHCILHCLRKEAAMTHTRFIQRCADSGSPCIIERRRLMTHPSIPSPPCPAGWMADALLAPAASERKRGSPFPESFPSGSA